MINFRNVVRSGLLLSSNRSDLYLQSARVEEHSSGVIGNRVYFSDEEDEMLEY